MWWWCQDPCREDASFSLSVVGAGGWVARSSPFRVRGFNDEWSYVTGLNTGNLYIVFLSCRANMSFSYLMVYADGDGGGLP